MDRMLLARMFSFLSAIALIGPQVALAQERVTVAGQVGVTFQAETAPVLAGEVGVNIAPFLQIYGTLGRMHDTLPSELQDVIDFFDSRLDISIPTLYGIGGVRAMVPAGPVRPYGIFGAGFARLSGKIEFDGEDVTDEVSDLAGLDDDDLRSTEFAFELGGGAMIPLGAVFVDAGYRYMRITGVDLNVSRVYGGVGVRF